MFPYAVESFDLSEYDLVISSSWAVAKGALTLPRQTHICYCHTPIRYAWDLTFQYLKETGLDKGLKGIITKLTLHYIRLWDVSTSNRVDYYIANSKNISRRIKKIYGRDSEVIHPPVDTSFFTPYSAKEDYYITISRFVPYKKIDIIIEAFTQMPDKRLIIIGEGPDEKKLSGRLTKNITILPFQPRETLKSYLQKAKAFVFAAEEDFGISIIEALSCGTPVIAFNRGGASETVEHGRTGIFFERQDMESIVNAVKLFESGKFIFDPGTLNNEALKYSKEAFEEKIKQFVEDKLKLR